MLGHGSVEVESGRPPASASPLQSYEARAKRASCYRMSAMASFLGLVLFLGLFPASFKGVEYYEYGFLVRSSTGKVDISRIYKP